jgi:hypothetical protein
LRVTFGDDQLDQSLDADRQDQQVIHELPAKQHEF